MDEPTPQVDDRSRMVLEQTQRFSHSLLWQLQRDFFIQQGAAAWSAGTVPHYITSNPCVASAYAQVMFAWLRDLAARAANDPEARLDLTQPIYIVELGAGSGR